MVVTDYELEAAEAVQERRLSDAVLCSDAKTARLAEERLTRVRGLRAAYAATCVLSTKSLSGLFSNQFQEHPMNLHSARAYLGAYEHLLAKLPASTDKNDTYAYRSLALAAGTLRAAVAEARANKMDTAEHELDCDDTLFR